MAWQKATQRGFTLVELVTTMVVLSILALGTTQFIVDSIDSYQDTARREELASAGRIAIEKVTRELRNAHPSTVRVVAGGSCVEFLAMLGSGTYQDQSTSYGGGFSAPVQLPVEIAGTEFDGFITAVDPAAQYVIVGDGDPYPLNNPGPMTSFTGTNGAVALPANVSRIQIASHRFTGHSPARRFYLLGNPVGYCVGGGGMTRHSGYALGALPTAVAGVPLAANISNATPYFAYTGATTARNALVRINLVLTRDGESVTLTHDVQIRNVP